jgi:hypothetical protein
MLRKSSYFLIAILILAWPSFAYACSVCFLNMPNDQASIALRFGVIFMLILLVGTFIGFITFFLNIKKRTKLMS